MSQGPAQRHTQQDEFRRSSEPPDVLLVLRWLPCSYLFIERKQFPPNLGESDHGNDVSPGNHRILSSKLAMVICIRAVLCSRMHYRFITKTLKSTKWEG